MKIFVTILPARNLAGPGDEKKEKEISQKGNIKYFFCTSLILKIMKIVNEPIKKGKLVASIEVYAMVQDVANCPKRIAEKLITGVPMDLKKKHRQLDLPVRFLMNDPFSGQVIIDYPLSVVVILPVSSIKTIGGLLWVIAKAYKKIYKNKIGTYGIWGHSIKDLVFENFKIYDNGNVILSIGS